MKLSSSRTLLKLNKTYMVMAKKAILIASRRHASIHVETMAAKLAMTINYSRKSICNIELMWNFSKSLKNTA
jgi:hypothetical protein